VILLINKPCTAGFSRIPHHPRFAALPCGVIAATNTVEYEFYVEYLIIYWCNSFVK
jgi:hypothetical protein